MAYRFRVKGTDCPGRGKDCRPPQESCKLKNELEIGGLKVLGPPSGDTILGRGKVSRASETEGGKKGHDACAAGDCPAPPPENCPLQTTRPESAGHPANRI